MLFLSGLMGMALLGSLVIFAAPDGEGEEADLEEGDAREDALDSPLLDDVAASFDTEASAQEAPAGARQAGRIDPGTDAAERLVGTPLTDLLSGGGGQDLIDGRAGDDELLGGERNDTVLGGAGNDTLHGDAGTDLLRGGTGEDHLFAHGGGGALLGGAGNDALHGGLGDDLLIGGAGQDALHGREGDESLWGGPGVDTLFGGAGADFLSGAEPGSTGADRDETDYLNGGGGDDTLCIGHGDVASGGTGADHLILGEWIAGGAPAHLMDFDPAADRMIVVYDEAAGAETPELDLRESAQMEGMSDLFMDGALLARMPTADAPALDQIVLLGADEALAIIAA